jgi:putative transposase
MPDGNHNAMLTSQQNTVTQRYRFGLQDRIVIDGEAYVSAGSDDYGHTLRRLDDLNLAEGFTHAQMAELVSAGRVRVDRGAFDPGQARAANAERDPLLDRDPRHQQAAAFRREICERFMELEQQEDWVTRSDPKMERAIALIMEERDRRNRANNGDRRAGNQIGTQEQAPSPRTLKRWLSEYQAGDFQTWVLADRYRRPTPPPSLTHEERELHYKHVHSYMSRNRPSIQDCHENLAAEIDALNRERRANDQPELRKLSYSAFRRMVRNLDAYHVCRGREGPDAAARKFYMSHRGLDLGRPMERLEIDEWRVSLQTLDHMGVLEDLTPEQIARLDCDRPWMSLALDTTTRAIAAMRLFWGSPSAASGLATLEMAVRQTDEIEHAVGASGSFVHGTPETVAADSGAGFANATFEAAVTALEARMARAPDKRPQFRGRVERVFGTLRQKIIERFPGQTFANVVEKGDYDAEGNAVLNLEELNRVLIPGIVDIYHNEPHEQLAGETPMSCWLRLSRDHGVPPPPDPDVCRHVFGIPVVRTIGTYGVRFFGIYYNSNALQEERRRSGNTPVTVRVDRFDLSAVSVHVDDPKVGTGWLTVTTPYDGMEGVSIWEWCDAVRDLQRQAGRVQELARSTVLAAVRRLNETADMATKRAELDSPIPESELLERADRDIFRNLTIQNDRDAADAADKADTGPGLDAALGIAGVAQPDPLQYGDGDHPDRTPAGPPAPAESADGGDEPGDCGSATLPGDPDDEFGDPSEWTSD